MIQHHAWQDPLAINTDLKSVTNSELLNLAILFQKSHHFGTFKTIFVLTEKTPSCNAEFWF